MTEIWKDIQGFEGFYQVSTLGRVKNLSRSVIGKLNSTRIIPERILSPRFDGHHYFKVCLHKDGIRKQFPIHRLVAMTFIENQHNYPEVNHINGNPKDNRIKNLEWVDRSQNIKHAVRIGLLKIIPGKDRSNAVKVEQYDLNGNLIGIYDTLLQAKEATGINEISIGRCARGIQEIAGGYKWKKII